MQIARLRTLTLALMVGSWAFLPAKLDAQIRASLHATQVESGCLVDDEDPFPAGDPERYFRMAIFDINSSTILNACANGCLDDGSSATPDGATFDECIFDTGCNTWNFLDRTLQKVVPDLNGVYFYFGLFDDDGLDASDLLGDHWFWTSGTIFLSPKLNNNAAPYYPGSYLNTVCGNLTEGIGHANNYNVSLSAWFEDLSAPQSPGNPVHVDATSGDPTKNDDDTLQFTWTPASDPNSGIALYAFDLYDQTALSYVFQGQPAPGTGITICPSGCDADYVPQPGHSYSLRAWGQNGNFPQIVNPTWASSLEWANVLQIDPATNVVSPGSETLVTGLSSPVPTPFSSIVKLEYTLERTGPVSFRVYDVQGRLVRTVVEDTGAPGGSYLVEWDGRSDRGIDAPPGVYFFRLETADHVETRKVTLIH